MVVRSTMVTGLLTAVAAVGTVLGLAAPAEAASAVTITKIYYDSPGTDKRSATSLDAEYVTITNSGPSTVTLTGWTLRDASKHVYTFPKATLKPGKSVTVHTGKGTDTAANRYWGSGNYVWNNDKDKATLKKASGTAVDTCSYNSTKVDSVSC